VRSRRRRFRIAPTRLRARSRRALRVFLAVPLAVQLAIGAFVIVALWLALNWVYQVVRKPAELLFPVSGVLSKAPGSICPRSARKTSCGKPRPVR